MTEHEIQVAMMLTQKSREQVLEDRNKSLPWWAWILIVPIAAVMALLMIVFHREIYGFLGSVFLIGGIIMVVLRVLLWGWTG